MLDPTHEWHLVRPVIVVVMVTLIGRLWLSRDRDDEKYYIKKLFCFPILSEMKIVTNDVRLINVKNGP